MKTENQNNEPEKIKESKFVNVIKFVFVKNIGYKVLAVLLSFAVWILTVGLA